MKQFLKKGALFLVKLYLRIFLLILFFKILSILSSFSGEKGSGRFAEPPNRTSKPNLEPSEPLFRPQKPNLEPTEPQKTERTSEPNQV